jgi:hypothetical protein
MGVSRRLEILFHRRHRHSIIEPAVILTTVVDQDFHISDSAMSRRNVANRRLRTGAGN